MADKPPLVCLDDYEDYASTHLDQVTLGFFKSGADEEISRDENRKAFSRLKLLPRVLRDVSKRDLSTTIVGNPIQFPVCIASSAFHRLACSDGEASTAKAAKAMNTCIMLSTYSTTPLEDVAAAGSGVLKWFQLYIWNPREVSVNLIKRAETTGFKALVLTVDTPATGKRRIDIYSGGFTLPPHLELVHLPERYRITSSDADQDYGGPKNLLDTTLTWECIAWMRSVTKLPIVLKGILSPEDALLAVEHKVDGIIVSNHGGRQLDTVPATIEMLPQIVKAVNGKLEVYLDGGVRNGTDVLKAIALGARAVFVGRPIIYGLVYAAKEGATQVLQILKDEFSLAMALSGCATVNDINSSLVVHQSELSKL
ncbi:2-Hydroxyacid oxidase 2-like [Saccoglossus kowalevskii]